MAMAMLKDLEVEDTVGGRRKISDDGVQDENKKIEAPNNEVQSSKFEWETMRTVTSIPTKLNWVSTWMSIQTQAGSSAKVEVCA
jgi:hypothetical protein